MEIETYISQTEDETFDLGRKFAERLKRGDMVALYGDLGAGKTEFVKGICDFFHVSGLVTSPTFSIMNQYFGKFFGDQEITIYHVDLYRIKSLKELQEIGFDECMHSFDAIKLVEWPENAGETLPEERYVITMTIDDDDDKRTIQIEYLKKKSEVEVL
jgi:tRNA threonylcarbamoyladenosine biosynthesis protein TsaE